MSSFTTQSHAVRTADQLALVVDLTDTMAAKAVTAPVARSLSTPVGLRAACPQDEIRRADERHNAKVHAAHHRAVLAQADLFQHRIIDVDEYRAAVRVLKARRDAQLVGAEVVL